MKTQTVKTQRLKLRRWKPSDYVPFYSLNSDPSVMEFMPKTLSREESDGMIQKIEGHFESNGFGLWALELIDSGTFVGFTGLSIPQIESHFTPCVEVGWRLARDFWGQGLASEAANAAVDFGFKCVNLEEIVSFTVPANQRSIAVMARLGMNRDPKEDFDHPKLPEGHTLRKHVLYRLKRKDSIK